MWGSGSGRKFHSGVAGTGVLVWATGTMSRVVWWRSDWNNDNHKDNRVNERARGLLNSYTLSKY